MGRTTHPHIPASTWHQGNIFGTIAVSVELLRDELKESMTMAQKVRVYLIDDIDGSDATETVSFSVDGVSYEIDLNEKHAQELRDAFSTWVGHARRATGAARRGGRRASTPRSSDAAAIRAWARENGYEVSDRGRVSAEIREAYEQRNR